MAMNIKVNGIDKNNTRTLTIPNTKDEDLKFLMDKMDEEVQEVKQAIMNKDFVNIGEECFDLIQVSVKLMEFFNIDIPYDNYRHCVKLKERGLIK